jgi:hypothetical protein
MRGTNWGGEEATGREHRLGASRSEADGAFDHEERLLVLTVDVRRRTGPPRRHKTFQYGEALVGMGAVLEDPVHEGPSHQSLSVSWGEVPGKRVRGHP